MNLKIKKYYPWMICGFGVLLHFCACGMSTVGFSTYLPYLKESLNLTSTETSVITTIRCLATMIAMLFSETFYKKVSLRKGVSFSCLLIMISYIIFGYARSAIGCYVAAAITGVSYAFGTMIPLALIIRNWFASYQATALSITACGSAISTAVMPPVVTALTENFSLRIAFIAVAVFSAVIAVILFLVIRDRPSDLKMEPYYKEEKEKKTVKRKMAHTDLQGKESIIFILAIMILGCSATPYTLHLTLHYTTAGYTALQAASALSIYGMILTFSKVLFGAGSDRFGTYRVNYMFFGAWIAAAIIASLLNGSSMVMLYATSILNGIGVPLGTIGFTVWSGDLSSEEQYAKRLKLSQTVFQFGSLIGTVIPGMLADITGSYASSYAMFALMLATAMIIIQTLYVRHIKGVNA